MKYSLASLTFFLLVLWVIAFPMHAASVVFVILRAARLGIYGQ